jgi:hypothetical protein
MSNFGRWFGGLVHRHSQNLIRQILKMLLALVMVSSSVAHAYNYQIGVFYFPGWKYNQVGAPSPLPWNPIKPYPERKPMLGWYNEGADDVMRQQLDWMQSYGINFVVFDWYFVEGQKVVLEHALATYMRAPNRVNVKFSILWANHSGMPKNLSDWQTMITYWVKYYFPRDEFLKINGRPVVFVFSADTLTKQAASFGTTPKKLLDSAQVIAREAGFTGIEFIAGTGAYLSMIQSNAKDAGYSGFSAYNYHQGPLSPDNTPSHTYQELDQGYQSHWQRFAEKGDLPLIVPMTSGWDRRPWGGSSDPAHDNSLSTPWEFGAHLQAAKSFMDTYPTLTNRMGVICCWNEFGEGSFVEPTEKKGFAYLKKIRDVFLDGSNGR